MSSGVVERGQVLDRVDRAVHLLVLLTQLDLELDRSLDPLLRCFEALRDHFFGDLRRAVFVEFPRVLGAAGLDHHDRDVAVVELAAGDDDLERRLLALLEGRVRDPLAVEVRKPHRADRTVERNPRHRERGRRAVDRRDVVRVLEVDAEDGRDDLHLVAEVAGERRAQRPVCEPAGQDRLLARPAFTPEERAGDLARGVHALFDVDGQREEVDAFTRLGSTYGRQQRDAADFDGDRTVGERSELAGFECHLEAGSVDRTRDADCVSHGNVLSFVRREAPVPSCQRPVRAGCRPGARD